MKNMKPHIKHLKKLGACQEAVTFADNYPTMQKAWNACERGDWLLWLKGAKCRTLKERRKLAFVSAQCARLALPVWNKAYPDDARVLGCLLACEAWSRGEISDDQLSFAGAAAGYAGEAAGYAAGAAWAAWASTLKQCAEIVRTHYTNP